MPSTNAAASSQWRTPVRRQPRELLSAAQSDVAARAAVPASRGNVATTLYLDGTIRFEDCLCNCMRGGKLVAVSGIEPLTYGL